MQKCRLVNIQKQWPSVFRILYVVSSEREENNDYRVSALSKTEDKYSYDDILFPVAYEDIDIFHDINKICVMVFEMADETDVVLS